LKYIAQLPDLSIVYHVDRGDIFEVHKAVGNKFCLSGGIPNDLLAFGTPQDVKDYCKKKSSTGSPAMVVTSWMPARLCRMIQSRKT
jgi:hypothetical protein